ncbi:MAG TPA: hypothetical protein VMW36_02125 [Patescibacteria group bacterium]|nr:hypothetical protein [Patescibacteria group bacterium]
MASPEQQLVYNHKAYEDSLNWGVDSYAFQMVSPWTGDVMDVYYIAEDKEVHWREYSKSHMFHSCPLIDIMKSCSSALIETRNHLISCGTVTWDQHGAQWEFNRWSKIVSDWIERNPALKEELNKLREEELENIRHERNKLLARI